MNLGDVLEELMAESGYIRSTDRCFRGIKLPAAKIKFKYYQFHRPMKSYAFCPCCKKRVGRKSSFRFQLTIAHHLGLGIIIPGITVSHRGSDWRTHHWPEESILDPYGRPIYRSNEINIHEPGSLDELKKVIERWAPPCETS